MPDTPDAPDVVSALQEANARLRAKNAELKAQIADALRGLIHAANLSRGRGPAAVPSDMTAEHLTLFRRGVTIGMSEVRRVPGLKSKQPPARTLLECLRTAKPTCCGFLTDTPIPLDQQPGRTRLAALQE